MFPILSAYIVFLFIVSVKKVFNNFIFWKFKKVFIKDNYKLVQNYFYIISVFQFLTLTSSWICHFSPSYC